MLLRSNYAPIIDKVAITPYVALKPHAPGPAPTTPAPTTPAPNPSTPDPGAAGPGDGGLPVTGVGIAMIAALGAVVAAMGVMLRVIARRRAAGINGGGPDHVH